MSQNIEEKVITFQPLSKEKPGSFKTGSSQRKINPPENTDTLNENIYENRKKAICNFTKISISIAAIIIITIILFVFLYIFVIKKNKKKNNSGNGEHDLSPDISETKENEQLLKPIFTFNNKVGDLKRITVNQTSYETMKTNGQNTKFLIHRNTTYDIYIKSEQKSEEKNKNFYSKKYIAVINIVKECFSTKNENCEPEKYMDLSTTQNKNNIRNLQEINVLKDIPIPICLIEFTDNDVIISISCPESLSKNKIYEITSDFYFFRPVAVERPEMNNLLKNITFDNYTINNKKITRERNSGICDTKNAYKTHCTTDMNTTTDLNNNVVSYDEIAFSNFTSDENNSYVKLKKTYLKDMTNQSEKINKEIYEKKLNNILKKIDPYLKKEELFSELEFENLYYIIKGNISEKNELNERNLNEKFNEFNSYIKKESLFFEEINGVQINLNLENDIGIDKNSMTSSSCLFFDDFQNYLTIKSEQSNLNTLLEKLIILSKAGNNLANELYEQIKEKLDNITKDISLTISSLNDLIEYNDLVSIFDSSLSVEKISKLPLTIISQSQNLYNSLNNKLIDITEIKNYKNALNTNIYNFLSESNSLINELLEKIKELGQKIGSPKAKLTEIATYYLNNTSDSYTTLVTKAENILNNYYKNEKELISNEVKIILESFEENIKNSIKKEIGIIKNIISKLESQNMTINLGNEDDIKKVILNLDNSVTKISEIISNYKDKIKSSLDLKTSGYFITETEIKSFQEKINNTIKEANENAQKFDHDELIDKKYDELMSNFRENFTKIKNFMNNKRDEIFFMDDDVLRNNIFNKNEKEIFNNKLKSLRSDIVNEIINENDNYNNEIKSKINNFISNKKESINQLIKNIDALFSESTLEKLSSLYKDTFENSFELIKNQINNNKELSYEYLDYLFKVLSNNSEIIAYIDPSIKYKYKMGQKILIISSSYYSYVTKLESYITNKQITNAYQTKYNSYTSNLDSSIIYISNQMYIDLSYEYKNLIIKLKTLLQSIKNNKFSDKYGDLTELTFVDDNTRVIDNLLIRLNKYFSETLFNNNYLARYNTFKLNEIQEIEKINQTLTQKHKLLTDQYTINNDKTNDFCVSYNQKVTHTCTCANVFSFDDNNNVCNTLMNYSNNHNQLITLSIKTENNFEKLHSEFDNFFSLLNENINKYNNVLTTLKNEITSLEINSINKEEQLINLNNINENINQILNQKYGEILIKESYEFYQKNSENKLITFLNNTNEKWTESFEILQSEIKKNKNKFKNYVNEFFTMSYIYNNRLSDILNDYTNSIIKQQTNEFNYTISYYYNYLYSLVNKTYQYIIGKIPTNRDGFNNILNCRKNQVIEKYNEIIEIIKNSENNTLNEKNQINFLIVPITNFYKVNTIVENSKIEIQKKLGNIVTNIKELTTDQKDHTEYSMSARLYLENSENGKIIQELSNSIYSVDFLNFNKEKFKELIDNNIVIDQENLLSDVRSIIYKSKLETNTEYQRMREKYIDLLENEIKVYFTKESLIEKIYTLYKNGINYLDDDSISKILLNVNEILEVITNHLKNESNRLPTTFLYNSNYEIINQTIKYYKENTFNQIKNEIVNLFETFKKNMYDKIYINYLEKGLNEYVTEIKSSTSNNSVFKVFKTLGDSYKIGDEINEIAEDLANQYKFLGKEEIENTINSNYYKKLNLEDIEQLVNEKIESAYNSILFPVLKQYAIYNVSDTGYYPYDLSDDIKNNINSLINEYLQKIKNIMIETKGENYDLNLDYHKEWKLIDFSKIGELVKKEIGEKFETYIINEINEEKQMFNNYFKNNINTNFNEMLNNFIPSFGKKFFERISEYNLNNRIDNLFNNYRYSSAQTFYFYLFVLTSPKNKFSLSKDLNQKILKINNIDLIIEQSKDNILKILAEKIDDFINYTNDYLVNKYISYMQQEENNIEFLELSEEIKSLIKTNLINSADDIKNIYKNILQNYLKNPLIKKYELYLIEKTNELIKLIKNYKQSVSSQIQDVPIVDSEEILNEINEKLNSTSQQINDYNDHFNQFKISDNIKQFLSSYGDNSIKPLFENIINLINSATKNIILQNLNDNSDNYEKKLDINSFNNKINESQFFINETYINKINNQIIIYDSENYESKLENEKDKIKSRRRRYLENLNTENDIKEDYTERVADKPLDDTFNKLLNTGDSVQSYIDSLNEFNKYDELIKNYINDINIAAKNSSQLIDTYNFEEEITNKLKDKLEYLKNISLVYYNNVNNSYSIIRNNIKNSIKKINDELKKCANVTYETFANNYINILNNEYYKSINKTYSENEEELSPINFELTTQNGKVIFETEISNYKHHSEFKFDIQYEENKNIKIPKIFASVKNKNIPKKIAFKIYSPYGNCGKKGKKIILELNDADYSTNLYFDTKSTDIKLTTNTKFDKYSYTSIPFETDENEQKQCVYLLDDMICYSVWCPNEIEIVSEKQSTIVDAREFNDTDILLY